MIDRSAHLDPLRPGLVQHPIEYVGFDAERDVKIKRVLPLEVERFSGNLEKCKTGRIVHLEKTVQATSLVNLEGTDEPKAEEILVEAPCFLRVPGSGMRCDADP